MIDFNFLSFWLCIYNKVSYVLTLDPPNLFSKNACIHVYGFLPCADNIGGYVFQVFSFCCLLIIGEYFLSKGRSKLFVIFEVGFFGGVIFPLLTMFPRIALIISTGLSGSRQMANTMVGNNVAVTVGYSVFALTMQWGASDDQSTKNGEVLSLTSVTKSLKGKVNLLKKLAGASVKADPKNKKAAGIMLLTLLPFVLVTFSETSDTKSWDEIIILLTLIFSGSATVLFFVYLYFDKADQVKSLEHARFELRSIGTHISCLGFGFSLRYWSSDEV